MITAWRKSSYSTSDTTHQCVEVGIAPGQVGIRDTKAPELGHLTVSRTSWRAFIERIAK